MCILTAQAGKKGTRSRTGQKRNKFKNRPKKEQVQEQRFADMSNLTRVNSQDQLRDQEQPQREGQVQIKRAPQCLGQPRGQGKVQDSDKPESFHINGLDRRFERLLVTAGRDEKTVKCIEPSNIDQQCAEGPLGRGAFGEVWAVIDPRCGQRVALKRLANIFSSRQFAIRVFREITCLTGLRHSNILGALDILQLPPIDEFQDVFVLTHLMDSDLYRIIISNQRLSVTHIKIFLYQVLRGLKYLHSGKIIHRDIKPANLLVNANCSLKICDFGLVRDDDVTSAMTQDVSTQYYRAPEMLMGAKHYTTSVDMWAVGCVFAELLSRRILFQANSPIQQLDLIMEVVGTPLMDDMKYACEAARNYILRQAPRKPEVNLQILHSLSSPDFCSEDAVLLLRRLLVFNPEKRWTASKALQSNYIRQGRDCYHSTICSCHPSRAFHPRKLASTQDDLSSIFPDSSNEFEPIIPFPFSFQLQRLEEDLECSPSLTTIRAELYRLCLEKQKDQTNPLRINTRSPAYRQFIEDQPQNQFKN